MELYYDAGKDPKTGEPVYIKCKILEDRGFYVVAQICSSNYVFHAQHNEFILIPGYSDPL